MTTIPSLGQWGPISDTIEGALADHAERIADVESRSGTYVTTEQVQQRVAEAIADDDTVALAAAEAAQDAIDAQGDIADPVIAAAANDPASATRGALDARYTRITDRPVNILQFGADPTGATDSGPALRSALAAAAVVDIGQGGETFMVGRDGVHFHAASIPGGRTIRGNGSTLRLADGTPATTALLKVSKNDITIRDVTLDGNKTAQSVVTNLQRHGIFVDNGSDVKILDVTAKNFAGDGVILWRDTNRITIRGGAWFDNDRNGISLTGGGSHIVIDGASVYGNTGQQFDIEADTPGMAFRHVRVTRCTLDGLFACMVFGTYSDVYDLTIENNTILGQITGINVKRLSILNNTIDARGRNVGAVGISYGADIVRFVGNNVMNDSNRTGLHGEWSSGALTFDTDRWLVADNEFDMGSGYAVRLLGVKRATVRGNRASGTTPGADIAAFQSDAIRAIKGVRFLDNEAWGYARAVRVLGSFSSGRVDVRGNHAFNDVAGANYGFQLATSSVSQVVASNNTADTGILIPVETPSGLWVRTGGSRVPIFEGSGTPEGSLTAGIGALAVRRDGTAGGTLYVKESGTGAAGWVAK